MPHDSNLYEVMVKASQLLKWALMCLLTAAAAFAALLAGVSSAKPVVFISVAGGAISLLVGLLLLASGRLNNDLRGR